MAKKQNWKNRIVKSGVKAAGEFKFNPLNWRHHPENQRKALNEVLSKIGWVTGVIENATTGNLIDGQARIEEALRHGPQTTVPFIQVELSETEERMILALFDPLGAAAETDAASYNVLKNLLDTDSSAILDILLGMPSAETQTIVELAKESSGAGVILKYLKFGKYQVGITDEEFAALETAYLQFVDDHGTGYGFAAHLLNLS